MAAKLNASRADDNLTPEDRATLARLLKRTIDASRFPLIIRDLPEVLVRHKVIEMIFR